MAEKQSSFDSPLSRRTKKTKKKEQNSALHASPQIRDRKLIFAKQESAAELEVHELATWRLLGDNVG